MINQAKQVEQQLVAIKDNYEKRQQTVPKITQIMT